jgi:hypothetical protein
MHVAVASRFLWLQAPTLGGYLIANRQIVSRGYMWNFRQTAWWLSLDVLFVRVCNGGRGGLGWSCVARRSAAPGQ